MASTGVFKTYESWASSDRTNEGGTGYRLRAFWGLGCQCIPDHSEAACSCSAKPTNRHTPSTTEHGHDDFRMPDNDGVVAEPSRIVDAGPDAYFSNLNVHSIETVVPVDDSHANVTVSLTAGSFLCNHTYFLARHFHADIPALFIHIPCLREETHTPDAFDRVTRSVNCIVQEITATLAASTPD